MPGGGGGGGGKAGVAGAQSFGLGVGCGRARDSLGSDHRDLLGFGEGLEIYSKCTQGSWGVPW